jgi:putative transposase
MVRKIQDSDRTLAEGCNVGAVLGPLNMTDSKYCSWRAQFGGLKAGAAKKLENQDLKLKILLAEAELETAVLKELDEQPVSARAGDEQPSHE